MVAAQFALLGRCSATMGVAHTGAFLEVWDVPHVENHITVKDVGRKLNKVFKWEEQRDSLRGALDGFVLVMVGGLSLLFLLPHAFLGVGLWAFPVAA